MLKIIQERQNKLTLNCQLNSDDIDAKSLLEVSKLKKTLGTKSSIKRRSKYQRWLKIDVIEIQK